MRFAIIICGLWKQQSRVFPATPACGIDSRSHPAMKAGRLPVAGATNQLVFDGIVMDVIEVRLEIILLGDRVFPKSTLPDSPPAFLLFSKRNSLIPTAASQKPLRETFLDDAPPRGIIRVAARQRPNGMQMVWQEHDGVDFKRPFRLTIAEHLPQQRTVSRDMKKSPTTIRHDSKKVRSPRDQRAAVIRHTPSLLDVSSKRQAGACPTKSTGRRVSIGSFCRSVPTEAAAGFG